MNHLRNISIHIVSSYNFLLFHLGSVCFHRCTVHKERSERISLVWIQGFAGKRRRGYTVNSKYPLPSRLTDVEGKPHQHLLFMNLPSFIYKSF